MGIRPKLAGSAAVVLALAVAALAVSGAVLLSRTIETAKARELAAYYEQLIADMEQLARGAADRSALVAHVPAVQAAMAADDRAALSALFVPGFAVQRAEHNVRHFQFHKAPATSFLRVHKPERFGDDLSGFRRTVLATNQRQAVISGLERGRAGIGLRGLSPITHDGAPVGSVEFGIALEEGFFQAFKARTGVDVAFFIPPDENIAAFADEKRGVQTIAPDFSPAASFDDVRAAGALDAATLMPDFERGGAAFGAYAGPVLDFSGDAVGAVYLAVPIDDIVGQRRTLLVSFIAIGAAALLVGGAISWRQVSSITRPIDDLTGAMGALAGGDTTIAIRHGARTDEIGAMARAVDVFRDNALKIDAMNAEKAAREAEAIAEREAMMADLRAAFGQVVDGAAAGDFSLRAPTDFPDETLASLAASVNRLMTAVETGLSATAQALSRIADGDLTAEMSGDFQGAFAALQRDVNGATTKLSDMIGAIADAGALMTANASAMRGGADEAADSAQRQAASLEHTAASIEEITASIQSNATHSEHARTIAADAAAQARDGGAVVQRAVVAMGEIDTRARDITEIVELIEQLAFQTNILALNASVEAARAGDAGRGFAVVATEVRSLAHRCSEASNRIRELIEKSGESVSDGKALVGETGQALEAIIATIDGVATTIGEVSAASGEQASAIQSINGALSELDGLTQRNADLAARSADNAQTLNAEAERVGALIKVFEIEKTG